MSIRNRKLAMLVATIVLGGAPPALPQGLGAGEATKPDKAWVISTDRVMAAGSAGRDRIWGYSVEVGKRDL